MVAAEQTVNDLRPSRRPSSWFTAAAGMHMSSAAGLLLLLILTLLMSMFTTGLLQWPYNNNSSPMTILGLVQTKQRLSNNSTTTTARPRRMTFRVYMDAEMGNHLSHLVRALILKETAFVMYGVDVNIVLYWKQGENGEQLPSRERKARQYLKQCFPFFRQLDYNESSSEEFSSLVKAQQDYWPDINNRLLKLADGKTKADMRKGLEYAIDLFRKNNDNNSNSKTMRNSYMDLPVVSFRTMGAQIAPEDLTLLRMTFVFDETNTECCRLRPDPDEIVFHYRNFLGERGKDRLTTNFMELSPGRIANELFADVKSGDKVAITTRINDDNVQEIVRLLHRRRIQVRLILDQSVVEDFCFLLNARRELVGTRGSSFLRWAAYLGSASKVRMYYLTSEAGSGRDGNSTPPVVDHSIPNVPRIQQVAYDFERR